MKTRAFRTIQMAALVLCLLAAMISPARAADAAAFSDVPPSHWAYDYVRACAGAGLIRGVGGGRFAPDEPLTTEQLVTLVGRACFGSQAETEPGDTWSGAYVRAAERLGVLENVDVGDMTGPVRRCDMAMLLSNVMEKVLNDRRTVKPFGEQLPAGYDTGRYESAIGKCYGAGLLSGSGDGYFHGAGQVTRAQAAKIVALLAGLELRPLSREMPAVPGNRTLYILMYHSVADDGTDCGAWTTTVRQFRADLQWLTDHGYTTVLPSELTGDTSLPEKTVMLTFDDGYADTYRNAYPLLREFGAKAVILPIVERVEDEKPGFLTWDMCREMGKSGLIEFGTHTYDLHAAGIGRLEGETRREYEARVFPDLLRSKALLEERLGQEVRVLAYPHGTTEDWAHDFVRSNFSMTLTTVYAPAGIRGGLYDLARYNASYAEPASRYLPG